MKKESELPKQRKKNHDLSKRYLVQGNLVYEGGYIGFKRSFKTKLEAMVYAKYRYFSSWGGTVEIYDQEEDDDR